MIYLFITGSFTSWPPLHILPPPPGSIWEGFGFLEPLVLNLLDVSPIGVQSQTFWVLVSPLQAPRVRVPQVRHKPPLLRKKLQICETPPDCRSHHWGGFFCETTSLPLLPFWWGSFLICCKGTLQLIFRSFSGNCFIRNCWFHVSVGGGEFSIFLHHHLGPPPLGFVLISNVNFISFFHLLSLLLYCFLKHTSWSLCLFIFTLLYSTSIP